MMHPQLKHVILRSFISAKLFESASQLGAVVAEQDEATEQAMAKFGMHLGTAFQLIDDVLDYSASSEDMGKNVGDDLAEGKPTLPLIYAMAHGTKEQATLIREAIKQGGLDQIETITQAIETTGALDYTRNIARNEAEQAITQLENIPDSDYKEAMITLAHFSIERSY